MLAVTTTDTSETFPAEPDVSERFARTVDAPLATVEAAAARLELIGPLVNGLIAIGLGDHIVTPCSNGLVWRFDPSAQGRVRLAWSVAAEAETDDASLVTIGIRVSASDDSSGSDCSRRGRSSARSWSSTRTGSSARSRRWPRSPRKIRSTIPSASRSSSTPSRQEAPPPWQR